MRVKANSIRSNWARQTICSNGRSSRSKYLCENRKLCFLRDFPLYTLTLGSKKRNVNESKMHKHLNIHFRVNIHVRVCVCVCVRTFLNQSIPKPEHLQQHSMPNSINIWSIFSWTEQISMKFVLQFSVDLCKLNNFERWKVY